MAVGFARRGRCAIGAQSLRGATIGARSIANTLVNGQPVPVEHAEFERLVADALARVPERFRTAMTNLSIVVEQEPAQDLLDELDVDPADTLLGLYQGTPLPQRDWSFGNTLPDRILIFQGPHEREAAERDDLVALVAQTLLHEIGHYYGLSEEQIHTIEQQYWKAQGPDRDSETDEAAEENGDP